MKIAPPRAWATLGLSLCASVSVQAATSTIAYRGADDRLLYVSDSNGNTVPDYSYTGYKLGAEPIPDYIPIKATVSPISGDDTANIQSAIDAVEAMTPDANGFRGAVYLNPGIYQVSTKLTINQSGVVVKGAGAGGNGTIIRHTGVPATGSAAKTFDIGPASGGLVSGTTTNITSSYVPVGAKQVTVASTSGLAVGDKVIVKSVPTAAWVTAQGLQACWTPSATWSYDAITIVWERKIVAINTTTKTLQFDQAFSSIIDTGSGYTVATVAKIVSDQRLSQVGIEDIMFVSDYNRGEVNSGGYYNDEDHADRAMEFVQAQDSWVRRCTGYFYSKFFVKVNKGSYRMTIEDCAMYDGVSLNSPVSTSQGGAREYYFSLEGKNTLVQRCYARGGRHAFVLNGPSNHNVFLHCYSEGGNLA